MVAFSLVKLPWDTRKVAPRVVILLLYAEGPEYNGSKY